MVINGQIAETVCDPVQNITQYAVYQNGEVKYVEFVTTDHGEFYPLDARNDLVEKRIVLLPSIASEYETTEKLLMDIEKYITAIVDISPMFEEFIHIMSCLAGYTNAFTNSHI